jgi:hypothetical protein
VKPVLAEGCLRLQASDVVVLLDGTDRSGRQRDLAQLCIGVARRSGARLRVGFLSDGTLGDRMPDDTVVEMRELPARGRFLTPLVEAGLLRDATRDSTLLCLTSGPIYDWSDWAKYVEGAFGRAAVVRLASFAGHHLAEEHDISGTSVEEAEHVLRAIVDQTGGTTLRLRVHDGVIHDLASSFAARPLGDALEYVATAVPGFEAGVAGTSFEQGAPVRLMVGWSTGDGSWEEAEFSLTSTRPRPTSAVDLTGMGEDQARTALIAYSSGEMEHACPQCGCTHRFLRAFRCEARSTRSDFLGESGTWILGAMRERTDCSRFALRLLDDGARLFPLPDRCVSALPDGILTRGHEGHLWTATDTDAPARPLTGVCTGMERLEGEELYVVSAGDEWPK